LVDLGPDAGLQRERLELFQEADELKRIFQAIAGKDDTGDQRQAFPLLLLAP
jgi:hypothetical protein